MSVKDALNIYVTISQSILIPNREFIWHFIINMYLLYW